MIRFQGWALALAVFTFVGSTAFAQDAKKAEEKRACQGSQAGEPVYILVLVENRVERNPPQWDKQTTQNKVLVIDEQIPVNNTTLKLFSIDEKTTPCEQGRKVIRYPINKCI